MDTTEMRDQLGTPLAIGDDVIVLIGTKRARMQLGRVSQVLDKGKIEVGYDYRAWYVSKDVEFKQLSVIRHAEAVVKVTPEVR